MGSRWEVTQQLDLLCQDAIEVFHSFLRFWQVEMLYPCVCCCYSLQMAHVQQEHKAQMDSSRVGAKQQLNAALQLHQQQTQEQLDRQVKELASSWAARCKDAEAAAAKQEALRAYADSEVGLKLGTYSTKPLSMIRGCVEHIQQLASLTDV